jgi:hypothetical protein
MKTATPVAAFKTQIVSGGRVNLKAALAKARTAKRFRFFTK